MDPMIKWPGGKSRELNIIKEYIPSFERYFEPFFGGGAVGLELEPDQAYVNDIDQKLIQFYNDVKSRDQHFLDELSEIVYDWRLIEELAPLLVNDYHNIFPDTISAMEVVNSHKKATELLHMFSSDILTVIDQVKRVDAEEFHSFLTKSIISKTKRVVKLQVKHETIFDNNLLLDHLMTAIKSAYYTHLRDLFNSNSTSAVFYFIREFCYGSMFRYNSKGEFNIPYGGINYNFKDIESKINYLQSEPVQSVLNSFEFYNLDFHTFFDEFKLSKQDFIFLDPPYDTDFKNYGKNPFLEEDQKRLAEFLSECPAKWLLVIKRSELIWNLYSNLEEITEDISIYAYDKKYTYNVRGRNDRDVSHLLITNYSVEKINKSKKQSKLDDYFLDNH